MANRQLFMTQNNEAARAFNNEQSRAYAMTPKHALAQLAMTGCLSNTYYVEASLQLEQVLEQARAVEPSYVAKVAVFAREQGYMKDMPALLLAYLSTVDGPLFRSTFARVIDSPKMLRNFVQIMRSGAVGRRSLGSLPKKLVRQWLADRTDDQLFIGSIGDQPSLGDIIRMMHPKPATSERAQLYAYLAKRDYDRDLLPPLVRQYLKFQRNTNPGKVAVPDVPMGMLTSLPLTAPDWVAIARNASWQTLRMNLNTFARHGVFENDQVVRDLAAKLRNRRQIERSKVMPYQLLATALNATDLPAPLREALAEATDIALANVPAIDGKVYVFPDISGSMHTPVTGHRKGATSKVRCIDVAALVAAALLRVNPRATVIPFESDIAPIELSSRASVLENARRLASMPSGGTNCAAPLAHLNKMGVVADMVIYVSDNESWIDPADRPYRTNATATLQEWNQFKRRCPQARMVCIDIQPGLTTQTVERPDIVNIGGFSDRVFTLIAEVAQGRYSCEHWVRTIESTPL